MAQIAMLTWLEELAAAKATLNLDDWVERTVAEMLVTNPKHRITMGRIRARFDADPRLKIWEHND